MAIMSFAHLKEKKSPGTRQAAYSSLTIEPAKKSTTGIMSFAHLKKGTSKTVEKPLEVKKPVCEPIVSRIPKVMLTAKLMKVNYCQGCPRFSPSVGWEKGNGSPYGRCLRVIDLEEEFTERWTIIPSRATVARCYYHIQIQNKKKEKTI
jgi:hypothetical protein